MTVSTDLRPKRPTLVRVLISFFLPAIVIAAAVGWFFLSLGPVDGAREELVAVSIPEQSGIRDISGRLSEAGLIRSRLAFEVAVVLAGIGKSLMPGDYEFSRQDSATKIARALSKGPAEREVTLTIQEGWTTRQIAEYVAGRGIGTVEEFIAAASVHDSRDILPNTQYDFLVGRPERATLEGYLFPDTYRVYADAGPADVVKKMLDTFGSKLTAELKTQLATSGHSLFEVLTLASIVEREVRTDADRAKVADIFWRRIDIGMPLQSDATVNYVTGKSALQPTLQDLETDSPYNTYVIRGLPPGPIGNPSLSSIRAVLAPSANTNLYFLTDESGGVHYAETYDQHLENKRRYLQ